MPEINIDITIENAAPEVEVVVEQPQTQVNVTIAAGGTITNAFLIPNKFSELSTEEAKAEARTNLGLQIIDLGTFY